MYAVLQCLFSVKVRLKTFFVQMKKNNGCKRQFLNKVFNEYSLSRHQPSTDEKGKSFVKAFSIFKLEERASSLQNKLDSNLF
jgi:hypothetical protein